jgi:hypothetical protein
VTASVLVGVVGWTYSEDRRSNHPVFTWLVSPWHLPVTYQPPPRSGPWGGIERSERVIDERQKARRPRRRRRNEPISTLAALRAEIACKRLMRKEWASA